jgi:hypothetical protein
MLHGSKILFIVRDHDQRPGIFLFLSLMVESGVQNLCSELKTRGDYFKESFFHFTEQHYSY